jgi:hypothetical protein
LPWDQLALWAVTVGTNMMGYSPRIGSQVRFIHLGVTEIAARGFDAETVRWVARKVDFNEYKREQAAPGLKVTSRAFGMGRRMPIAQRYSAD